MARFLFVVPPLHGHTVPTLGVAGELEARGHTVAWAGYQALLERQLPQGAQSYALDGEVSTEALIDVAEKARSLAGLEALKFLWAEVFIPLARAMRPGVEHAAGLFQADVLVVDHQAMGGAIAARALGLPWASSCTSGAERHRDLADMPKVLAWTEERLLELWRESMDGTPMPPAVELSPFCALAYTSATLFGSTDALPVPFHFVGPVFGHRPAVPFPWDELREGRRVYLSLGTVNPESGERFYAAAKDALGDLPLQVIASAPEAFGPFPANFLVRPFVPQLEVLREVDAVICHGGYNTLLEAFALGLPVVVAPIKDDQLVNAKRVTEIGAGIRLSFRRPRPHEIRAATLRVLEEPGFGAAAREVQADLQQAGGAARAAELLEGLVGARRG